MPASVTPIATKAMSCFAWSVEQMLEAMLQDIREGKVRPNAAVIVFTEENPDRTYDIRTWRAQMTWPEEYAYLGIAQEKAVNRK